MRKLENSELGRLTPEEFEKAAKMPLVVVLDNVRSGYNVGSIFRTCDAFPVQAIYLCGITCHPPHKEINKTALGSDETVAWKYFKTTQEAVASLKEQGYKVYAVEQTDKSAMLGTSPPIPLSTGRGGAEGERLAVIFGHEVDGVKQEVIDLCDGCIEIPQGGTKHSLNIAVSAGVVLWEFYREFVR